MVFIAQGKRLEISAAQRTEIWRCWKARESLHEIGRAFGRKHASIHLLLSHHGGIVRLSVDAHPKRSRELSERTFREESLPAYRFVQSPPTFPQLPQRRAGSSHVMAAVLSTD